MAERSWEADVLAHHGFFHPELWVALAAALPVAWVMLRRSMFKGEA